MIKESLKHYPVKGRWWDLIHKKDTSGNTYLLEKTAIKNNLIVTSFASLLAGLLSNEPSFFGGILYHAIGEGLAGWDVSLPSPTFSETELVNEFYRKSPESIKYFDSPSGSVVTDIRDANVILIETVFDFGTDSDPFNNKFIRSQGLVGGDATAILDSGLFLDIINHKAIFKSKDIKLTRFIEITLG